MSAPSVFRFAPSPNGKLHLGHAYSACVGFEMARRTGGRFLVRIEDIDVDRCRDTFVAQILDDLAWLGLSWEEPVLRQSKHFETYRAAARRLETIGVLYPCFATRTEIAEAVAGRDHGVDPDGAPLYPQLHKGLDQHEIATRRARGEPFALRIDMERALGAARGVLGGAPLTFTETGMDGAPKVIEARPERWGDAVIVRKEVPASYHLAVTVDDARQGVTHVTRGMDLFAATDLHRLLQVLLGLPEPVYHHHRLITDGVGRKLAKSARDTTLKSLRVQGLTPRDVQEMVGFRLATATPHS